MRSWGLALRTSKARGRGRIWGTSAVLLMEPAEAPEASIGSQAISGAGQWAA